MSPTESLVLEVLIARHRLGEHVWTFDSRNAHVIRALSARGLVVEMGGVVPKTVRASLTEAGRDRFLSDHYVPPTPPPPARVYAIEDHHAAYTSSGPFAAVRAVDEADALIKRLGEMLPDRAYSYREVPVVAGDQVETVVWWEAHGIGPQEVLAPTIERKAEHQHGPGWEEASTVPETVEVVKNGLSRPEYGLREVLVRGRDEAAVRSAVAAIVEKIQEQKEELGWVW